MNESTLEAQVKAELERILDCPTFRAAPKLARLLRYLVKEALAGQVERIKAYAIAVDVFNQPASFDPQTNPLVRVQVGRLRNLLERYYLNDGRADLLRIEIPRGGYLPLFQTEPAAAPGNRVQQGGDSGDSLLQVPYGPSLAVLPCRNLSGDPQQDYLCDGMTQELIHLLTECRELHVIAPNTMFQYRARGANPRHLGNELGVDYVLSGTVRIGNDRIRVIAGLTDTETGIRVWTQSYDQTLTMTGILGVQEDIAQRIAALLGQPHGVLNRLIRRKPTAYLEAYTAVLRYYEYVEDFSPENHARARDALDRAIALDPDYAEAWGALAGIHGGEYTFGFNPRPDDAPPLERAYTAARRSVQLEPGCVIGQYNLALSYYYQREMALFRETAERALSLAPNRSDLLANLGLHLAQDGQWERGLALLDKARVLNPLHPGWYYFPYALDSYRRGCYDEALITAHQLNLPHFFWEHLYIAMICGQLGRDQEAQTALARLLALRPDIATDADRIIEMVVLDPALVAHCIEGLRKAGLNTALLADLTR